MKTSSILAAESAADYGLLDSGNGEKLERFGAYTLARPDPQALWEKHLPASRWDRADGSFKRDEKQGGWSLKKGMPERWPISYGGLKFYIRPSSFKHTGLFPEQSPNWDWLRGAIEKEGSRKQEAGSREKGEGGREDEIDVLNLFGYTGGATLACAQAGAKVVHVDGSKVAISWARENAELSGLKDKPVRWILDDARTFVKREAKRGRTYAGIIMDPPAFGHGPENELWKIEDHFLPLFRDCLNILDVQPLFFLINGYAAGYSAIAYENVLLPLREKFGGAIETGELAIRETAAKDGKETRLLPAGIFARWSSR